MRRRLSKEMQARNTKILEMHEDGFSNGEIGRAFGVTAERVRQIINRTKRRSGRGLQYETGGPYSVYSALAGEGE